MAEHPPKVYLVLEGSEDITIPVGLVKDYHGTLPYPDEKGGDLVGTWSRFGKGTFYVSLTTPVEAMQDTLIQLVSEIRASNQRPVYPSYSRGLDEPTARKAARKPVNTPEPEPAPSPEFSNLRARLGARLGR